MAEVIKQLVKWWPVIVELIEGAHDPKATLAELKAKREARRAARDRRMGR